MNLGLQDLALFTLTVLVLNATPGVDLIFTLTRTLQHGVRGGLAAAAGISAGCVIHAVGAAFGLAALMATSADAFDALKLLGAMYLAWLAFGMLRNALRTAPAAATGEATLPDNADTAGLSHSTAGGASAQAAVGAPIGASVFFSQGLLTNVTNPKVAIFFLALLPQFIAVDAPDKTTAFLVLGAWFVLQSALFLAALVMLVAPLRSWQPSAKVQRALHGLSALLFIALALRLALAEA
ncbi:Lysine exporter protein (LYSE/YGGA) [Leptothrix cholodnii SP-6]|uniref:Lysine exporter protein (LYSE/YGGA) n=1 Tax=Leptothrix cholodnii (strain ATCC 51168 / LMG 8142 / SP-6) TaxID=395495 RepID=B1XYM1_LEPCP|nr:LysE family translocator [Leptothrix cholodnii]ACB36457.1 Lysine exporter protein (LYSE/YGGA) [Leptothrix cholodnii SP-6]